MPVLNRPADSKATLGDRSFSFAIGLVVRMSILDTEVDCSNPSISMFFPRARDFIRIASVDSAVK